jgi:hypothetical protein
MEIENGALNCALVNDALPETLPAAVGAKVAVKVALFPGFKLAGRATPLRLKPVPDGVACEIVTAALPELVSVKL